MGLRAVFQIFESVNIPIIGMGGISCLEDVIEFIYAGASAISIGTMNLVDPELSIKLIDEFNVYFKKDKIKNISELTGIAHN